MTPGNEGKLEGRVARVGKAKLSRPPERVVFDIRRGSRCSECEAVLEAGSFLIMEASQPLCLPCAGLGGLEYLPAGDAALTRRGGRSRTARWWRP